MSAVSDEAWHEGASAEEEINLDCSEILFKHEFDAEQEMTKIMGSLVREALWADAFDAPEAQEWMLRVLRERQTPDVSGGLESLACGCHFSEDASEGLDSCLAEHGSILPSGKGFSDFYGSNM